jgi:hypothetical protein
MSVGPVMHRHRLEDGAGVVTPRDSMPRSEPGTEVPRFHPESDARDTSSSENEVSAGGDGSIRPPDSGEAEKRGELEGIGDDDLGGPGRGPCVKHAECLPVTVTPPDQPEPELPDLWWWWRLPAPPRDEMAPASQPVATVSGGRVTTPGGSGSRRGPVSETPQEPPRDGSLLPHESGPLRFSGHGQAGPGRFEGGGREPFGRSGLPRQQSDGVVEFHA